MRLKTTFCLSGLLFFSLASAQSGADTLYRMVPDSTMIPPPPLELMEYPSEIGIETTMPYDYNPVNKFKYNKKIRPEDKPDKKAVYSLGLTSMLEQISDNLNVPFTYESRDRYVILQFVVGKDSVLYNPEVLFSPGADYSINATNVIERLDNHFLPATKNGKPVDTIITIPIRFAQKPEFLYGAG